MTGETGRSQIFFSEPLFPSFLFFQNFNCLLVFRSAVLLLQWCIMSLADPAKRNGFLKDEKETEGLLSASVIKGLVQYMISGFSIMNV